MMRLRWTYAALVAALAAGCGGAADEPEPDEAESIGPFASRIVSYEPGEGAGYGQDRLDTVVIGAPSGKGTNAGSLDVLSLGVGGEIVLGFDGAIVDGEGPDFAVYENAFWVQGERAQVFAELGEVSVSEDGETWETFSCALEPLDGPSWPGCAGWSPTLAFEWESGLVLTHELTGGDVFDLADVGLERALFVRVRDLSTEGDAPTAGFDLDAVGAFHFEESE